MGRCSVRSRRWNADGGKSVHPTIKFLQLCRTLFVRAYKHFAISFVLCIAVLGVQAAPAAQPFTIVVDAFEKIRAHAFDSIDERKILEAGIDGLFGLPGVDQATLAKLTKTKPPPPDQTPMARLEETFTQIRTAFGKRIDDQSLID